MIKIVVSSQSEEEMYEAFRITTLMKRELKVPFLHICGGQSGKLHRDRARCSARRWCCAYRRIRQLFGANAAARDQGGV